MKKIKELILNTLFPPTHIEVLLKKVTVNTILSKCKHSKNSIDKNINAVFCYKDPFIKDAIIELKTRNNESTTKLFGEILYNVIKKELRFKKYELKEKIILTFIPQHISKFKDKGFNQTEELVNSILKNDIDDVFEKIECLEKIKNTKAQKEIENKEERFLNIKGAFKITKKEKIENRVIVLIDDVCTTGGTFKEARQILSASGASKVICFSVAH